VEVTNVRVYPFQGDKGFRGYATVTLDHELVIKLTVRLGKNGLFICFPSKKEKNKETQQEEWKDQVFPLNQGLRSKLNQAVVGQFEQDDSMGPSDDQRNQMRQFSGSNEPPPHSEDELPF